MVNERPAGLLAQPVGDGAITLLRERYDQPSGKARDKEVADDDRVGLRRGWSGEGPDLLRQSDPSQQRSGYWNCLTASIILRAVYGFATNKLPGGISSALGAP